MPKVRKTIRINAKDNVIIALEDLPKGAIIFDDVEFATITPIKRGHKIATRAIKSGEEIIKYGFAIGIATQDIACGEHIHSHNCRTNLDGNFEIKAMLAARTIPTPSTTNTGFLGFRRDDGSFGIRNEIWIIPTVGCVANICQKIARAAQKQFPDIADQIQVFGHQFGCSQLGGDLGNIRDLLGSLICHPNAYRVLLVGLGCENNQGSKILEQLPENARAKTSFFKAQEVSDEITTALEHIALWHDEIMDMPRTPAPLSALKIAIKCGGSDGMSGLSANPLVGRISDKIAAAGGTIIMGEIPEIFGAEQVLLPRCRDIETQNAFITAIKRFKDYFTANAIPVYENPSPGNKDGGITTLEEKSLGAVQKAGNAVINAVIEYGKCTESNGLNVVYTPGNDGISSTAFAAAGAHIILFTTGRGTPMGFPVPTLKIASNSALAHHKPQWIDFDAGQITQGHSLDALADDLMALIIATANGKAAQNELNDEREIAIWKNGVTL